MDDKKKEYVLSLTKLACLDARKKFVKSLKGMTKNSDKLINKISDQVVEYDGYDLDIMDF